ncbi:MAG: hypothetical protein J5808_06765 [Paludibacteraceae bacterium]|nr:hypothetical protein [Paludibacteraceae bacterium]
MKKLVLFFATVVAVSLAACNNCNKEAEAEAVEAEATEVIEAVADSAAEVVEEAAEVAAEAVAE